MCSVMLTHWLYILFKVSVEHIFANGDLEVKAIFKNAMDRIALDWDRNFAKDGSVNISAASDGVFTL